MKITALAGGIGAARFLRGLLRAVPTADITVIGNTADDIILHGLHISPDLDTVMYTLGGGINEEQGWGRADETFSVAGELAAYRAQPQWFTLGDRDIATHIIRTQMLAAGYPLSEVTAALCERWDPGLRLIPMTDDRVETHVVISETDETDGAGQSEHSEQPGEPRRQQRAVHFQEWWVRLHAAVPTERIVMVGIENATPAPAVLDAIHDADVIVLPPSNPVVSIGPILSVPGIRAEIAASAAPVVGLSPIIGGRPVRGMADAALAAIGLPATADAVAGLYRDLADGWLVDETDTDRVDAVQSLGISCRAVPLLMHDVEATAAMATAALDLVGTRS